MRRLHIELNKATQLMNAPAAWNLVGGQSNAGKGRKIGILDTGIDQNHPAFQDSSLAYPPGFPKCSGSADACNYTNTKVIVARSYISQLVIGDDPTTTRRATASATARRWLPPPRATSTPAVSPSPAWPPKPGSAITR
jgi:subtilisin family serine protease